MVFFSVLVQGTGASCPVGYFQCQNARYQCIPDDLTCDSTDNCVDGSDEGNYLCKSCLSSNWLFINAWFVQSDGWKYICGPVKSAKPTQGFLDRKILTILLIVIEVDGNYDPCNSHIESAAYLSNRNLAFNIFKCERYSHPQTANSTRGY